MTIKSILYSAFIILMIIILIEIGLSFREKVDNLRFKIIQPQIIVED